MTKLKVYVIIVVKGGVIMLSNKTIEELSERYCGFDFDSAIRDITEWQAELSDDLEDSIKFDVLESVIDVILDRCNF